MWLLKNQNTGFLYFLSQKHGKHIVSRSKGDIRISGDSSISRKHATLEIIEDKVILIDCESKYGTFINDNIKNLNPVNGNTPITLKENDRILFGRMGSEWILVYMKIKTLYSTLSCEEKDQLKNDMELLECEMTNEFSEDCTHLTMPVLSITIKVLQSLIIGIPIVTPNYWKEFYNSVKNFKPMVDSKEFIPKLNETFLRTSSINFQKNRKNIFKSKRFIFMVDRQMNNYETIIKMTGGECLSLLNRFPKAELLKENTIVIQYISSSQGLSQSSIESDKIYEYLKKNKKRVIPECEIGLAILFGTTEKYCNPDVPKIKIENVKPSTLNIETSKILAIETPLENGNESNSEKIIDSIVIPESDIITQPFISKDHHIEIEVNNLPREKECDVFQNKKKRKPEDILEGVSKKLNDVPFSKPKSVSPKKTNERVNYQSLDVVFKKQTTTNNSNCGELSNSTVQSKRKAPENNSEIDDLFVFKPIIKKKRSEEKEENILINKNVENSDLFNFKSLTPRNSSLPSSDLLQLHKERIENNNKKEDDDLLLNYKDFTPLPKEFVDKVIFDDTKWLSRSFSSKLRVKSDPSELEDVKPNETTLWIESLKNGFEIKNDISVIPKTTTANTSTDNVSSYENEHQNKKTKNFKAFVKKNNFKKQLTIIPVEKYNIKQ